MVRVVVVLFVDGEVARGGGLVMPKAISRCGTERHPPPWDPRLNPNPRRSIAGLQMACLKGVRSLLWRVAGFDLLV